MYPKYTHTFTNMNSKTAQFSFIIIFIKTQFIKKNREFFFINLRGKTDPSKQTFYNVKMKTHYVVHIYI